MNHQIRNYCEFKEEKSMRLDYLVRELKQEFYIIDQTNKSGLNTIRIAKCTFHFKNNCDSRKKNISEIGKKKKKS